MVSSYLPAPATSFIGRNRELADIAVLLADPHCHLLTLVGPGGIGKTRLAIEAVSRLTDFADGVYFVPLQPIHSVENLITGVATALNLQFHAESEPEQQLFQFLREKHLLLLLDNFEHLLAAATFVADMLQSAPRLKLLVTSREALNLREEWVRSLDGLDYPQNNPTKPLEAFNAVQLFIDRVHQVRGDFSLAAEHDGVRRICQMVEGMPLALELAAARAKTLPCAMIADEIQQSIDFLSVSLRNLPERHRSMQAVFAWSWQLLNETEQTGFMSLSVFQGGFISSVAQAVVGVSRAMLSSLIEKSLLRIDESGRYQFHDLLHRFASGKLNEMRALHERTLGAHCAYYLDFLTHREDRLQGTQRKMTLAEIEGEIANVRAAWTWAVDHQKWDTLARAREALYSFYFFRWWVREGKAMFASAAAALPPRKSGKRYAALRGYLLLNLAAFFCILSDFEASEETAQESLVIFRQTGDLPAVADALLGLRRIAYFQGDFQQASIYAQESLTAATQTGDELRIAYSAHALADFIEISGRITEARRLLKDVQIVFQRHDRMVDLADVLASLGNFEYIQGDYEQAQRHLQEALLLAGNHDGLVIIGAVYERLGQVMHAVGDFDNAERYFEQGLALGRANHGLRLIGWCLYNGGQLACARGDYDRARERFQEVIALALEERDRWKHARALGGFGRVAYATGNLQEAEQYLTESLKRSRELGYRRDEAQVLNLLAHVAMAQGNVEQARQHFTEALEIGLEIETPPTVLESLAGVAELKTKEGAVQDALDLCNFCLQHPALHADVRAQVTALLQQIGSLTRSTDVTSLRKANQPLDLQVLASSVLRQLTLRQAKLSAQTANQALTEPLSERELDVLRLIEAGDSNQEIAERLVISVTTVKKHINHLYGKLSVENRTQAIVRARVLHLL